MNENFQPRRFTLTALRNMLHRLRLDYVDFCQFLENPWVHYDPIEVKVTVRAPYWQTVNPRDEPPSYRRYRLHGEPNYTRLRMIFDIKRCAILPPEVVGSPEWPIHIRADDEDALAVIPFNLPRYIAPEATPPQPVTENIGNVVSSALNGGAGGAENLTGLFGHGLWNVD
ncbi:hypothetical protein ACJIZ3_020633 [Penstemon smallii]